MLAPADLGHLLHRAKRCYCERATGIPVSVLLRAWSQLRNAVPCGIHKRSSQTPTEAEIVRSRLV